MSTSSEEDFLSDTDDKYGSESIEEVSTEEEDELNGLTYPFIYYDYSNSYSTDDTDEREEESEGENAFIGNEMNNNLYERLILSNFEQRPDFASFRAQPKKHAPTLEEVLEQSKAEYDLSQKIITFFQDTELVKSTISKLPNVNVNDPRFQEFFNGQV
ncbi:hypothetical protein GPJ56_002093 [Histomonas meleagridis]|uniref:uncharacterized protein n=1 Tax=Histomonas meleagridis TaxID=135588 RepID=UPI003559BF90|nr:hypothetical protein GPJ56_002093 [Histomonas meleagridis]KAH0806730.1 hypothetical protein GO595_000581 [Histomonas meleagridis]